MSEEISLLFVDDEDSIRLTLPLLLEKHGFKVIAAATVPEALKLIAEHKFQVLLTDLNIGHAGDGFAVVSAMRSTQPQALCFILTGYPAFESALQALQEQVDDYIVKPAETEELIQRIRSKLQKRIPAQLTSAKRVPEVFQENISSISKAFLNDIKTDSELSAISISDSERTDHIPRLLDVAMRVARSGTISEEDVQAAMLHGTARRRQGYTAGLLIREARILKQDAATAIQTHLLEVNISFLVRDLIAVFETIDILLERSVEAFTRKPQKSSSKVRKTER